MGNGASSSQGRHGASRKPIGRLATVDHTKDNNPSADQAAPHEVNGKFLDPRFRLQKNSSFQRSFHSMIASSTDLASFIANAEFLLVHSDACKDGKIVRNYYCFYYFSKALQKISDVSSILNACLSRHIFRKGRKMFDLARSQLVEDILASVAIQTQEDSVSRDRFLVILTYTYAYVAKDESFLKANTKRSPLGRSILNRSTSGLFQPAAGIKDQANDLSID